MTTIRTHTAQCPKLLRTRKKIETPNETKNCMSENKELLSFFIYKTVSFTTYKFPSTITSNTDTKRRGLSKSQTNIQTGVINLSSSHALVITTVYTHVHYNIITNLKRIMVRDGMCGVSVDALKNCCSHLKLIPYSFWSIISPYTKFHPNWMEIQK